MYPATHRYKRRVKASKYYFDRPSCMRAWDEDHKSSLDKRIDELKRELIYLELQGKLPPHDRDVKGDILQKIEKVHSKLATAIEKRNIREGLQ